MLTSTIGIQDALIFNMDINSSAEAVNPDITGQKQMGTIQCQHPKQARVDIGEVDMSDSV